jgi:MoaA/NifB/PqqE/SkfB family radical SAM enzyme
MFEQSLSRTYRRYRSLQTHRISILPIVILMPHSGCNCRCIMCDIWKGNRNLKQLTENDISSLLRSFKILDTQQVVMSGGEALLNPLFFRFCELLKEKGVRISLLSTGLALQQHAHKLVQLVDDIIVSLDGDATLHNHIRNIPNAFEKMKEGIDAVMSASPGYHISARSVIHKLNFRHWPAIVETALSMQLKRISFLPADTTSEAFNRAEPWNTERQCEILPSEEELSELSGITETLISDYRDLFASGFIAESPEKIRRIPLYYSAMYGYNPFPYKKCNAPWVSTVIEADGTVRPCFFHAPVGNIREQNLDTIVNGVQAFQFRKELDMDNNDTCRRCVCYLNLKPGAAIH